MILSCLSIIFPNSSILHDLKYGEDVSGNSRISLTNLENVNAIKLNGNELEVLAAVTLLESSHHQHGLKNCSFRGQNIKSFICNIACNLLKKWEPNVTIDLHSIDEGALFNLQDFLSNHIVPYLYPANCQVPDILEKLTDESQIYVGHCKRNSDNDKVDFSFSLSRLNSDSQNDCLALIECKNWFNEVSLSNIEEILSKSFYNSRCTINFIFCKHLIDPVDPTTKPFFIKKFETFCQKNKICVYTFQKTGQVSYKAIPFPGTSKITEAPEMVSFIFELTTLTS